MTADPINAIKGYQYLLRQQGMASIDEVNSQLKKEGLPIIHQRTYTHYRSLLRYGFRSYIPINQFDVSRSLGKIQLAADRRQYARQNVVIQAQISIDGQEWTDCTIVNRSLVGLGVETKENLPFTRGSKCWLRIAGYYDIPGIQIWSQADKKGRTQLGIRAFEFIAKFQKELGVPSETRLTGIIKLTRENGGEIDWENIIRILGKLDELINSIYDLLITTNIALRTDLQFVRPVLISIRFGSPGQLQTKVDLGLAEILKILIEKFQFWSIEKQRYKEENKKRSLENEYLHIEVLRNALNYHQEVEIAELVDQAIETLRDPLKKTFDKEELPKELFGPKGLARGIVSKRILPALAELLAGDDSEFKIDASESDEQEGNGE